MEALEQITNEDIVYSDIPESLASSETIHNSYELLEKGEPPFQKARQSHRKRL